MIFRRGERAAGARTDRQVDRESDWVTQYTLEGARQHDWRECRVLDVSRTGIGLQLAETTTLDELSAYRVVVAVEVPRASLRLRGDVRHLEEIEDGACVLDSSSVRCPCLSERCSTRFLRTRISRRPGSDRLLRLNDERPPTTVRARQVRPSRAHRRGERAPGSFNHLAQQS